MSRNAPSTEEVPGWVILSPTAVPDAWRSRTIPMVLVPLTPAEASELLSDATVEQGIAPADLPLIHLVARGYSAAEISRELGVALRTVNRHVARLRDEFGVATIQELASELARRGFG
ncbi:MAG TPA: LuxR C-terminal-related transcriptional regulator [Actinomycetota bacterium]|nr:LuxR C-terminal-related transcriptional regulator [Actinomycetota bacterium]